MTTRRLRSTRAIAAAVALAALHEHHAGRGGPDPSGPAGPGGAELGLGSRGTSDDPNQPNNRPNLSYELDPGAVVEDAVTLYNYGNVPLNFEVYATDAFNNEQGEFDILPGDQAPDDVGSWITLPSRLITLQAGTQLTLPITVTVPDDAKPGDHVGGIVAASKAVGTGPDGAAVSVDRRTGTRVYLRVAGPVEPELAVEHVKTTYTPSLNPLGGTAEVTYTIRNRGNVRLAGTHQVEVSGPFGLFGHSKAARRCPSCCPGERYTVHAKFTGVPAAVLEQTKVHVDATGADAADGSRARRPLPRRSPSSSSPSRPGSASGPAGLTAVTATRTRPRPRRAAWRPRSGEVVCSQAAHDRGGAPGRRDRRGGRRPDGTGGPADRDGGPLVGAAGRVRRRHPRRLAERRHHAVRVRQPGGARVDRLQHGRQRGDPPEPRRLAHPARLRRVGAGADVPVRAPGVRPRPTTRWRSPRSTSSVIRRARSSCRRADRGSTSRCGRRRRRAVSRGSPLRGRRAHGLRRHRHRAEPARACRSSTWPWPRRRTAAGVTSTRSSSPMSAPSSAGRVLDAHRPLDGAGPGGGHVPMGGHGLGGRPAASAPRAQTRSRPFGLVLLVTVLLADVMAIVWRRSVKRRERLDDARTDGRDDEPAGAGPGPGGGHLPSAPAWAPVP